MAGYRALAAAGRSVVELLRRGIVEAIPSEQDRRPTPVLVSTVDLDNVNDADARIRYPSLAVYCYRLTVDRETRPVWAAVTNRDGRARLPLRMHLLLTAFDEFAESELEWLGLGARILESDSILTGHLLDPTGGWAAGESLQIVPDDMALESMSEAFQALTADFRLYLLYQVRVVVIEGRGEPVDAPVTTVGADMSGAAS